jgi:hypothetical protein
MRRTTISLGGGFHAQHAPHLGDDPGPLRGAYVATLAAGGTRNLMGCANRGDPRERSLLGAWRDFFGEMAKKVVVKPRRQLAQASPLTPPRSQQSARPQTDEIDITPVPPAPTTGDGPGRVTCSAYRIAGAERRPHQKAKRAASTPASPASCRTPRHVQDGRRRRRRLISHEACPEL